MEKKFSSHVEFEGFVEESNSEILVEVFLDEDPKGCGVELTIDVGERWGNHLGVSLGDLLNPNRLSAEEMIEEIEGWEMSAQEILKAVSDGVHSFLCSSSKLKKQIAESAMEK